MMCKCFCRTYTPELPGYARYSCCVRKIFVTFKVFWPTASLDNRTVMRLTLLLLDCFAVWNFNSCLIRISLMTLKSPLSSTWSRRYIIPVIIVIVVVVVVVFVVVCKSKTSIVVVFFTFVIAESWNKYVWTDQVLGSKGRRSRSHYRGWDVQHSTPPSSSAF